MNRKTVRLIIIVDLVLIVVGAAVAGFVLFGGSSPEKAIAAVIEKTEKLESYGFSMDAEIEAAGQEISMELEGVSEGEYDPATMKMSASGSMQFLGQTLGISEIMADGRLFVKYDPNPISEQPQWYYMDLNLQNLQSASQSSGGSPSEYLQYMKAYSTVEEKGDEEIDGVACTHYYLVIDMAKLGDIAASNYEVLAEQMPGDAAEFDRDEVLKMYEDAEMTMDIWVGVDDGMPHRQSIEMSMENPVPMTATIVMDLFDFNEPVDVEAPSDAVPLPGQPGSDV